MAVGIGFQRHPPTLKMRRSVISQRHRPFLPCSPAPLLPCPIPSQKSHLHQHLKPIANPQHRSAAGHKLVELLAEQVAQIGRPQHPRPQIIPIRKAAGNHQHVVIRHPPRPADQLVNVDNLGVATRHLASQGGIAVAVGAVGVENQYFGIADCGLWIADWVRSGGFSRFLDC